MTLLVKPRHILRRPPVSGLIAGLLLSLSGGAAQALCAASP